MLMLTFAGTKEKAVTDADLLSLDATVRALAPIDGIMPLQAGEAVPAGAHLVTRADGVRVVVHYQPGATPGQITAGDNAVLAFDVSGGGAAARLTAAQRTAAKALINLLATDLGKALRAEAAVLVDEINLLRQWITSFKAAVAAATTLADLKTRVAALPAMPDRTLDQAKTAILGKIDSGLVD